MRLAARLVASGYRHHIKGTGRVAAALYRRTPYRTVPTTLNGMRWEADPLDWMDQRVLSTGTYEPEITALLLSHLLPGDVLWDVGANAGVHSLSVKRAMPKVTVVAFEPSPVQYARLAHNAALNGLEVTALCVALSDARRYASFSVVDVGNGGHNSLVPWPDVAYSRTFPAWCDTGDDIVRMQAAPSPTVLKVDVEGGEAAVFAGMKAILATASLRAIVFEAPADLLGGRHPVAETLQRAGLRIARIASTGGGVDWLALREAEGA